MESIDPLEENKVKELRTWDLPNTVIKPDGYESNGLKRSETWNNIYEVLVRLDLKETTGDCMDRPSAATEIEELFLKLLSIQNVSNQRELLIDLLDKLEKGGGNRFVSKEWIVDTHLQGNL